MCQQRSVGGSLNLRPVDVYPTPLTETALQQKIRRLIQDGGKRRYVEPRRFAVVAQLVADEYVPLRSDGELVERVRLRKREPRQVQLGHNRSWARRRHR